jgi:ferric-dicitrate binding protein FerR (iron transport regulator)
MKPNTDINIDLITRYFAGEATPFEVTRLNEWVESSPANRHLFDEYRKTWQETEKVRIDDTIDLDQEWAALRSRMKAPEAPKAKTVTFGLRWYMRVAAMLVLLAIPTFLIYRHFSGPAMVRLEGGTTAMVVTLSDGTSVSLDQGAVLEFPESFRENSREVRLTGQAFFDVTHDAAKPFVVEAGEARIEVLGTTFTVDTRTSGGDMEVILATGKVKVSYTAHPEEQAILTPGEKAEIAPGGMGIIKTLNDDPNFMAWKTRILRFDNTPLSVIAATLSEVYHKPVRVTGNGLASCRVTATFDNQSLESVLAVLKATLGLEFRDTGNAIEIYGPECK